MTEGDDNLGEIGRWLHDLVSGVDFTMPGADQSLGRDLANAVAQGIIDRTVADQLDADGKPLRPNEAKYAATKARRYRAFQPALRTGQTLSLRSVLGETRVTADAVELVYGVNEAPSRAASGEPSPLPAADTRVTDRRKAQFLTDGGRPFYGLDEAIAAECVKLAGEALTRHLQ